MSGRKRLAIVVVGIVALGVLGWAALVSLLAPHKPTVDASQVVVALQQFCAAHKPLPETVTFSQLIAEGYLSPNFLKDFGAKEVTVHLKAEPPQRFTMDALLPDGSHTVLESDGSVLGLSPGKSQELAPLLTRPETTNAAAGLPGGGRPR